MGTEQKGCSFLQSRKCLPVSLPQRHPSKLTRKFSAGDAAHSFPPTGGLGLNSGLADVHNLAYKIAAVHHGWGGSKLLDTYGSDRRHVALVNSAQSIKNGVMIFKMLKTFGLNHPDVEAARANLFKSLNDPHQKLLIDKGVEDQQEHFDNARALSQNYNFYTNDFL